MDLEKKMEEALLDHFDPWSDGGLSEYSAAAICVRIARDAAGEVHRRYESSTGDVWCEEDMSTWPCPTMRVLGVE